MLIFSESKCINASTTIHCGDCKISVCKRCAESCHEGHKLGQQGGSLFRKELLEELAKDRKDEHCGCAHQHPKIRLLYKDLQRQKGSKEAKNTTLDQIETETTAINISDGEIRLKGRKMSLF